MLKNSVDAQATG